MLYLVSRPDNMDETVLHIKVMFIHVSVILPLFSTSLTFFFR